MLTIHREDMVARRHTDCPRLCRRPLAGAMAKCNPGPPGAGGSSFRARQPAVRFGDSIAVAFHRGNLQSNLASPKRPSSEEMTPLHVSRRTIVWLVGLGFAQGPWAAGRLKPGPSGLATP